MTMHYSKSTKGFYDDSFRSSTDTDPKDANKPVMPADVVTVDLATYAALMEAQSAGAAIVADNNGNPVAVQPTPPSAAQIAQEAGAAALAQGISINSSSTPTLNGVYALTPNTLLMITGAISYCLLKNQFPGGASTLTFFDAAGVGHVFTTIAEFEAFGEAVASYVTPIQAYINSGGTQGALPTTNTVLIP